MPWKIDWLPLEEARQIVVFQGFTKYSQYEAWKERPHNIPSNPRAVYGDAWRGREYWLGIGPPKESSRPKRRITFLPFEEARKIAHQIVEEHQIVNQREWFELSKSGQLPPHIPADPSKAYAKRGWNGWPDWFGRDPTRAIGNEPVRSFEDCREFARSMGFRRLKQWKAWARGPDRPADIPYSPEERYENEGWQGWGDFLGNHTRWTKNSIVVFLQSLIPVIENLSETELFLILTRNGMLKRDKRFSFAKLLRGLHSLRKQEEVKEAIQKVQEKITQTEKDKSTNAKVDETISLDDLDLSEQSQLCDLKSVKQLKVLDDLIGDGITEDEEILNYMVSSRVAVLWKRLIEQDPEFTLEKIQAIEGGNYTNLTRDQFLQEHQAAVGLPIPAGYAFHKEGQLLEPNLMQRLTAWRLLHEKRLGNWSGVGAGKTVSALYAAGVCGAKFTLVVAANFTLEDWQRVIKNVYPQAKVFSREGFMDPQVALSEEAPNFLVVNYESFHLKWVDEFIGQVFQKATVDFLVLDEIQSIRQRTVSKISLSRQKVLKLIAAAEERNPELRILGMSATPVVNNLLEGKSILEPITGSPFESLQTGASISNAISLHTELHRHGIRYVPSYETIDLNTEYPKLDGQEYFERISNVEPGDVLSMEKTLVEFKIRRLKDWLAPRTILYTQYVEGIVAPLKAELSRLGYRVAVQTGRSKNKKGLEDFKAGRADVLIGSSTIGTGVDELQYVCNRLIFMSLPWSNAEYQQIVGRLHRQGSRFDRVDVIIPLVVLREAKAGIWSWDDQRRQCIEYKQTLADAATDGAIPRGRLPTKEELHRQSMRALEKWIEKTQADASSS